MFMQLNPCFIFKIKMVDLHKYRRKNKNPPDFDVGWNKS